MSQAEMAGVEVDGSRDVAYREDEVIEADGRAGRLCRRRLCRVVALSLYRAADETMGRTAA
jgi:hypothetical protein